MKITYQGSNIMQPIPGEIQAEGFSVNLLNASSTRETLSMEEQAAQAKFETEREELMAKIIAEQDAAIKAELQAQLDELDAKERDRHNENVSSQLVENYMLERDAQFAKVKTTAGLVLVMFIVVVVVAVFKHKSRKNRSEN